jgi:hypothetical protein
MPSNLPPGVTDRMIDEAFGHNPDDDHCLDCGAPLGDYGRCPDCDCDCDPPEPFDLWDGWECFV